MADTPPPPPPPPSPGPQPGLESVGAWPRLGARILDYLVLLIPTFIVAAIIGGTNSQFTLGAGGMRNWLAGVVTVLITFGYFVYLESSRGQTLGKMALGCKVVGPDGRYPSTDVAARRNAWLLLSVIPFLGGLLQFVVVIVIGVTISNDPFNRGWHDNFAGGTAVVRAR